MRVFFSPEYFTGWGNEAVKKTQTPNTGLPHASANHCHNLLRHRVFRVAGIARGGMAVLSAV